MDVFNNSFALIIGVDAAELPSTQDATDIRDVLIDKDFAGYPEENVILLTKQNATRKGILDAFDEIIEKTNVDSKVFLYYSGHGAINENVFPNAYYLEAEGWNIDHPDTTGVKGQEIKKKLNGIIAERLIFIFDCCHAQGMTEGPDLLDSGTKMEALENASKNNQNGSINPEGLAHDMDDEEGMAIISSCKDNQKSLYFKGDRNSMFTAYLLKVLKGEHQTIITSEYIKILDVASYLVEEVPKDAALANRKQNPFINLQFDRNFEVSRVPKSKRSTIDKTVQTQESIQIDKKEIKSVFRKTDNTNNVIIFVHGFSGEAHESFGKMPNLFMEEKQLDGWDMFPFGFNANTNPEMGKDIWATVKDINKIADNLSSAIKYKFNKYNRVAIVAYSLGGLVAQRAILNLDESNKERLSHVFFFGTPSNGITNNTIKTLWKNKISTLVHDQPFIQNLRADWKNTFKDEYPFTLKVIVATKDEYVTADSSLSSFKKSQWVTVSGDHFSMVNIKTKDNDSYNLILDTLNDNTFFNKFTNQKEINLAIGEFDAIIRELEPNLEHLDERGLEHLIDALESVGRSQDAEHILKTHPIAKKDADMLNLLGGLYKRKYLENSKFNDGKLAFNCYTEALKLAQENNQTEQICKNAVNLAFLNLILEEDYKDMNDFANIAISAAQSFPFDKLWKLRSLAEGHLYLNDLETSKKHYILAVKKASIKDKIEIYSNAYSAYVLLNDNSNSNDPFINFLRLNYLS